MPRIPAHRRRRDPYARQILGAYHAPEPDPGCAWPGCAEPESRHERNPDGSRGRCLNKNCRCLAWRPAPKESSE